jgi:hypothetical protein
VSHILEDSESGELMRVNSSKTGFRMKLKKSIEGYFRLRDHLFDSCGLDHMTISSDRPYVDSLVQFFKKRIRRLAS